MLNVNYLIMITLQHTNTPLTSNHAIGNDVSVLSYRQTVELSVSRVEVCVYLVELFVVLDFIVGLVDSGSCKFIALVSFVSCTARTIYRTVPCGELCNGRCSAPSAVSFTRDYVTGIGNSRRMIGSESTYWAW